MLPGTFDPGPAAAGAPITICEVGLARPGQPAAWTVMDELQQTSFLPRQQGGRDARLRGTKEAGTFKVWQLKIAQ